MKEYEAIDSLYDFTIIIKTWHFKNSYLIIIVQMFRILFDLPRSSILNKDLLLHVNPYKTLKNVHTIQFFIAGAQYSNSFFQTFFDYFYYLRS